MVDDYKFRLMNLLVKNQLREGNWIKVEMHNEAKVKLQCWFEVITYNKLWEKQSYKTIIIALINENKT